MIPNKVRTKILDAMHQLYYDYSINSHSSSNCPLCITLNLLCCFCPNIVFETAGHKNCVGRKGKYISHFRTFNQDQGLHAEFWRRTHAYLSHVQAKYWYNKTVTLHIHKIAYQVYWK